MNSSSSSYRPGREIARGGMGAVLDARVLGQLVHPIPPPLGESPRAAKSRDFGP